MSLPIRLPNDPELRARIVSIVDKLQSWTPLRSSTPSQGIFLFSQNEQHDNEATLDVASLERELDNSIFDLYELSEPNRDLVRDMCDYGLEFFYNPEDGKAVGRVDAYPRFPQGVLRNLPTLREEEKGLEGYLHAFLQVWNRELEPDGEFRWRIIRPPNIPMLAVVFTTQEKGAPISDNILADEQEWDSVLQWCSEALLYPVGERLYIDGIVRAVTDTNIFIIRRDERRLWTRSMAREDAEAILVQAMNLQSEAAHKSII